MYSGTMIVKRSAREENGIIQMINRRNGNKEEREKIGKERGRSYRSMEVK